MNFLFNTLIITLAFSSGAMALEDTPKNEAQKENLIEMEKSTKGAPLVEVRKVDENKPPVLDDTPHFFFGDTAAVSAYTGFLYHLSQTDSLGTGMFGLSYMWHSDTRFHIETALDIFGNQESHIRVMAKWISNFTADIRPFLAVGLGIKILPTDNLGVILAWSRLMPHLHLGFDMSTSQHWSLKAELFTGVDQSANSYFGILTGPVFSY